MAITTDMLAPLTDVATNATPAAPLPTAPPEPAATPSTADVWKEAAAKIDAMLPEGQTPVTPAEEAEARQAHWETQPRDGQGKWTLPPAPEGATPDGAARAEGEAPAAPEAEAQPAPQAIKLTLPNVRDPKGEGVEVELEDADPELEETVRAMANAFRGREETKRRQEAIERRELDARELETMIRSAPEMLLDSMSRENRQRFVLHGLVNHFEEFRPLLTSWVQDDMARREAALQWNETAVTTRRAYEQQVAETRQAHQIERAVVALVPWSATEEDARDFRRAALMRLAEHAESGKAVHAAELPNLLARDLARFGWLPEEGAAVSPSLLKTVPAAASEQGATPAPTQAKPARSTPDAQAQRRAAAAVTPGGGAAVPPTTFPVPKTMEDARRILAQIDPASWRGLR